MRTIFFPLAKYNIFKGNFEWTLSFFRFFFMKYNIISYYFRVYLSFWGHKIVVTHTLHMSFGVGHIYVRNLLNQSFLLSKMVQFNILYNQRNIFGWKVQSMTSTKWKGIRDTERDVVQLWIKHEWARIIEAIWRWSFMCVCVLFEKRNML